MSNTVVERMAGAIDAVADVDLDALSDDDLDDELVGLMRQHHRLAAEIARRAQRWDARSVWRSDGSRSAAGRLARDGLVARATADQVVRAGRAVASMPLADATWRDGDLSADHVDLLRRAAGGGRAELFARDEWLLVRHCRELRYVQASKAVRYWIQRADAELAAGGSPPPPESYLRAGVSFQGTVSGEFVLDPIGGATVLAGLHRIERELYRAEQRDGVERSKAERMAAALVEMAVRANAAPADGRRPEPLVMILAGEATVEHVCELATGAVIDPHLIVPHLARADVQTIVFDGAGRPVAGSTQRTFRGMLRRAIQVRDRHCQHESGCDAPIVECDVNHVIDHAAGGLTDETNGDLECTTHNRDPDRHGRSPAACLVAARRRRDDEDEEDRALAARMAALERTRPDPPSERAA